jgi:hypothetical protein
MWKYSPFWDFARYLLKLEVVNELVIINNDSDNTPDLEILKDPKIKIINPGKNIYVNQAWNYGVHESNSDILCVINDDLIFDLKIFYMINEFITDKMGCVCLSELLPHNKVLDENGELKYYMSNITGQTELVPYINQSMYGYGVLFFIHKDNWVNIPSSLIVFYGDNFVFEQCYYRGLQNYMIDQLFHYHAGAKTTSVITQNGKRDNLFVDFERKIYENEIRPKMIQGNFNF